MKYLKKYELFGGATATWNELFQSIHSKNYIRFKEWIDKVDIEEEDMLGYTALLLACQYGTLHMVKDLIKKGADINHKNNKGEDFYDIADQRYQFINSIKDWIEKNYPEIIMAKKYNL